MVNEGSVHMERERLLDVLKRYKPVLEKNYGVVRLGIFGSAARGEMKNNSDVDIVVEVKNLDPFVLLNVKEELTKLLDCEIDLIRLRKNLNRALRKRIERDVIYV